MSRIVTARKVGMMTAQGVNNRIDYDDFIKMRIATHHLVAIRIIMPRILYFGKEVYFILSVRLLLWTDVLSAQ